MPKVIGRMKVQVLGNPWSPWYDAVNGSNPIGPIPGASITVPSNPVRTNTNDTLNFLIPPAYCTGDVIVLVEVRVVKFDECPDFPGFSETIIGGTKSGLITFENRHALNLRYVRVNWTGVTPTDAICQATLQNALPLLPAPFAVIQPLANTGIIAGNLSNATRRDNLLDDFHDQHNCSAWEMATEFLGSDCPDEDDEIWVLIPGVFSIGKARNIPGNVCFTPPNDGPYAGHELAHCLNQSHVGVACPNGQTAQGGDTAAAWPNNGVLVDVPFDVSINSTVPGGGTTVWDMMTYCGTPTTSGNNTWPYRRREGHMPDVQRSNEVLVIRGILDAAGRFEPYRCGSTFFVRAWPRVESGNYVVELLDRAERPVHRVFAELTKENSCDPFDTERHRLTGYIGLSDDAAFVQVRTGDLVLWQREIAPAPTIGVSLRGRGLSRRQRSVLRLK